jgi:DNA phosphorothioation-associated putative methyltransferase
MVKVLNPYDFESIAQKCQSSKIGKLLPNALYVHTWVLAKLDEVLQNYESRARSMLDADNKANIVKFSLNKPKISYLLYPDFDSDPHPRLQASKIVDTETLEVSYRNYSNSDNPPILHRKEAFVTPDYPLYAEFAQLTRWEVALGLLDDSRFIGTLQEWQQRLWQQGIDFEGHYLVCSLDRPIKTTVCIERHKAAIVRKELSRPVRLALGANLFDRDTTFFDYGCGYGGDVERIGERGYSSAGCDPYYYPDNPIIAADIVNLGYVINVIEDPQERRETLIKAWELTRKVLIVAAQVLIDDRHRGLMAYGDGIVTSRNTFQKYYEQEELKNYIDRVLDVDAIPLGLGIYAVFRDEAQVEAFRASRFHSRVSTPKVKKNTRRFEDYEAMLAPLMTFFAERGRLPVKGELEEEARIKTEFRSFNQAFKLILEATDQQEWDEIAYKRSQELLLYLALSKFSNRPSARKLPYLVREDIKAFFGNYKYACQYADRMLFSLNNLDLLGKLARESPTGQKRKNSLSIHISALESLDPLLRLYEGCASCVIGRLEGATVIKFSLKQPKISYFAYPTFDLDAHPIPEIGMEIDLQNLQVKYRDYNLEENPPILHQKETLVNPDYPLYQKFAKLTQKEKDWGLLDNYREIDRLQGWLQRLKDRCATIKGHQLLWRKDADPYKIKLLRSKIQARRESNK